MRTAIVTGGGSGICQAVGPALCAAGWTGVIAGRKVETLERARQLTQGFELIETHVTDVTDDSSVEQLFDAVVERYGRLALLFNNAGITELCSWIRKSAWNCGYERTGQTKRRAVEESR